jgi:hypothetical protein
LEDDESPDFWWLNNGVTILSTAAGVVGESIKLNDIQIVNGLQTTESIYRYFASGGTDIKGRSILVKIIVSSEKNIRDTIIKATNNQTNVELASLHATDKIQRDIEDVLVRSGLFYERRKNYYLNLGHSPSDIITPLYLAAGYVNLILKSPVRAARLRNRFMRIDSSYNTVFSPKAPINVWPKIAISLKKTDEALDKIRPRNKRGNEHFLKRRRQITCFLAVSKIFGKYDFSVKEMEHFDESKLTESEIIAIHSFIFDYNPGSFGWKKKSYIFNLCRAASDHYSITGIKKLAMGDDIREIKKVDMDFALKVNEQLPSQPWKPGVSQIVTKTLKCTNKQYFSAVKMLIEEGIRNHQKDGVVYDSEGNVLCFDTERVDPVSMELLSETETEPELT